MNTRTISQVQLAVLAGPVGPMFALAMAMTIFIAPYYANQMGIGVGLVGVIFSLSRLWDVVTDPVAGLLMDRYQHTVSRPVWFAAGCPVMMLSVYMLFFASAPSHWLYFLLWLLVYYMGWTLMLTAIYSWAAELSNDYDQRSRIMGGLQMANVIGTLLILVLAASVERVFSDASDLDSLRIHAMGLFVLVLMPLATILAYRYAPKPAPKPPKNLDFKEAIRTLVRNKPLRLLLAADFLHGFWMGAATGLSVFFIEHVLGNSGFAATSLLVLMVSNLIAVPIWVRISYRIGKHRAMAYSGLFGAAASLLVLFLPPGEPTLLLVLWAITGTTIGAQQFLPRAIMADVLDEDRLATGGEERAGLFYSFLTSTIKIGLALSAGVTLVVADAFGFDPTAEVQSDSASMAVRLMVVLIPAVLNLIIAAMMWNFPLGSDRQRALRSQLNEAG